MTSGWRFTVGVLVGVHLLYDGDASASIDSGGGASPTIPRSFASAKAASMGNMKTPGRSSSTDAASSAACDGDDWSTGERRSSRPRPARFPVQGQRHGLREVRRRRDDQSPINRDLPRLKSYPAVNQQSVPRCDTALPPRPTGASLLGAYGAEPERRKSHTIVLDGQHQGILEEELEGCAFRRCVGRRSCTSASTTRTRAPSSASPAPAPA